MSRDTACPASQPARVFSSSLPEHLPGPSTPSEPAALSSVSTELQLSGPYIHLCSQPSPTGPRGLHRQALRRLQSSLKTILSEVTVHFECCKGVPRIQPRPSLWPAGLVWPGSCRSSPLRLPLPTPPSSQLRPLSSGRSWPLCVQLCVPPAAMAGRLCSP